MRSSFFLATACHILVTGCATPEPPSSAMPPPASTQRGSFASLQPVLETHCVHCHGKNRLAHMPPFGDTLQLSALRGDARWIVPGEPRQSRFYTVVTLADDQAGAMPPTGHAIPEADADAIKAWIEAGAPIPDHHGSADAFRPRGEQPRSR